MAIFIVDYWLMNQIDTSALIIEASNTEEARELAITELKSLGIPKRNIRNIERFV